MKIAAVRRWKAKERQFNRQYRLKTIKKSQNSRDLSGKFVFLLSKTNLCAVVKFISKNVCVTETLLVIDEVFLSRISPKYVIPHNRHKKLLDKSEVRITQQFRICCEKFYKKSKKLQKSSQIQNALETPHKNEQVVPQQQELKKITPIKILSCNFCNEKFLKRDLLDDHISKTHFFNTDASSDSESELHIDDDVELMLDENNQIFSTPTPKENITREEVKNSKKHIREFKCLQCSARCATEDSLLNHIERTHPCSSTTSPQNLIGYNVETNIINNNSPNQSLDRKRSLSTASSFSSISNQSAVKCQEDENKIKYERFDSELKKEFSCRMCSTVFQERKLLNRHLTNMHLYKVYKCYKCNVPFNKKLCLVKHLNAAHLKYKNDEGFISSISNLDSVGYFQCCFCKYSSKLRCKVAEHMTNEHYEDFEKDDGREDSISSSPDSLEELLLPETRALRENDDLYEEEMLQEMEPNENKSIKKKKPPNDPSFRYRCARCQKRFSRSSWLKKHPCPGMGIKIKSEPVQEAKKPRLSYLVNGFLRCTDKSCSKVFTDRKLYDHHVNTEH